MSAALRRGACPTLAAPMLTGDGWLARLAPAAGLTAAQLAGLAAAAERLGNGLIEVTARGSLQVRGLTPATAAELAARAGRRSGSRFGDGLPVVTGPLAGLDPGEIADPRPLAAAIRTRAAGLAAGAEGVGGGRRRRGAAPRRGGGGRAAAGGGRRGWEVAVGGRLLGAADAAGARRRRCAARWSGWRRSGPEARGRDLAVAAAVEAPAPARAPAVPVGRLAGGARGSGCRSGRRRRRCWRRWRRRRCGASSGRRRGGR